MVPAESLDDPVPESWSKELLLVCLFKETVSRDFRPQYFCSKDSIPELHANFSCFCEDSITNFVNQCLRVHAILALGNPNFSTFSKYCYWIYVNTHNSFFPADCFIKVSERPSKYAINVCIVIAVTKYESKTISALPL